MERSHQEEIGERGAGKVTDCSMDTSERILALQINFRILLLFQQINYSQATNFTDLIVNMFFWR